MTTSRAAAPCLLLPAALLLQGCLERTIRVTTQPPGAVVWLNDQEMGRTPVEVDFTYFGKYSVRIRKEGFEPITTTRTARAPLHEQPGLDLAAEALPLKFETNLHWHWDLEPALEASLAPALAEQQAIERATQLRARASPPPAAAPSPTPSNAPSP